MKNSKKLMRIVTILCMLMLCCCIRKEIAFAGEGRIVQIEAGYMLSTAVGDDGVVYTWGNNFYGSLGDKTNSNRWDVREASINGVKSVYIDGWTVYALKKDGTVWKWGGLKESSTGAMETYNEPKKMTGLPTGISKLEDGYLVQSSGNLIDLVENTTYTGLKNPKVICRGYMSIPGYILSSDGLLYKFGKGYTKPTLDESMNSILKNVVDIDFGNGVFIACTADGGVYTWGDGYLGNGYNTVNWVTPTKLNIGNKKAKKIAAGENMYLILDENGQIWQWGKDPLGYNLFGNNKKELLSPTKVESKVSFTDIESGREHNLAVDVNGEVYEWGYIRMGEFGERLKTKIYPEKLVTVKSNLSFDTAWDFESSSWNCAITTPSEMRYYKFTPDQTTYYEFGTISDKDTYGYLYDSTGKQLASNDDGRGAGASDYNCDFYIKHKLIAGQTYYIGVRMYSSTTTGKFSVYKRFYDDYVDEYNDSGVITCKEGVDYNGQINYYGDKDVIKFIPDETAFYSFESNGDCDVVGELFDSKGKVLLSNDDKKCNTCQGKNQMNKRDYYIEYKLKKGETYYLSTKAYNSKAHDLVYSILITNKINDDFEDEINNNIEAEITVSDIYAGLGCAGYISCDADKDIIGIKVKQSGTYDIKSNGIETLKGTLFDSNGKKIVYSDNSKINGGDDNNFCIRQFLEKDKLYYVQVENTAHRCKSKMYTVKVECYDDFANDINGTYVIDDTQHINCMLNYENDVDVIAFIPKETCVYSVDSISDANSNIDLVAELYDSAGRKVAENDNAEYETINGNRSDFSVEYPVVANQLYYVRVKDFVGGITGKYQIKIRKLYTLEVDNYYDASFVVKYGMDSPHKIIYDCTATSARILKKEFNVRLKMNLLELYESEYDKCDRLRTGGTINKSSILEPCNHSINHKDYMHNYRTFIASNLNKSNDTRIFVLWTGSKTNNKEGGGRLDDRSYCSEGGFFDENGKWKEYYGISIMGLDAVDNGFTLAHEISHMIGASDHYHELVKKDNIYVCNNQENCDVCNPNNGRESFCLMSSGGGLDNNTEIYCGSCKAQISSHLYWHHAITE